MTRGLSSAFGDIGALNAKREERSPLPLSLIGEPSEHLGHDQRDLTLLFSNELKGQEPMICALIRVAEADPPV